ncbi:hypothetical protein ACSHXN_44290 (plasmid) [Streptomyces sp. HUAS TT11]
MGRTVRELEQWLKSGYVDFGFPAVTVEQVDAARPRPERAEQHL